MRLAQQAQIGNKIPLDAEKRMSNDVVERSTPSNTPAWFWVIGGVMLLWNLLGLMAFASQMAMTDESLKSLPAEQQKLYTDLPQWVSLFFAIAVIGGTLGCIVLLLRRKFAVVLFVASLVGVLVQYGHMLFFTETASVMGMGAMALPAVVVIVSIALVPYSMMCNSRGLLR